MFDGMKEQMGLVQKLLKDENFKQWMMHPKFQSLMQNTEFMGAVKSKDKSRIMTHPKLAQMKEDPEFRELFTKINFESLL